jgi:stage V sporulation protein SpoVS
MTMMDPAEKNKDGYLMKVGASTPPQAVASSIVRSIFDESRYPVMRAVGAGAVAQTCKGIAIARGLVAPKGLDLSCTIGFDTVKGDNGQDISAQTFYLHPR